MPKNNSAVECSLLWTSEEFAIVVEMMRIAGVNTMGGLVNLAMWNYARHLNVDPLPAAAFKPIPEKWVRKKSA